MIMNTIILLSATKEQHVEDETPPPQKKQATRSVLACCSGFVLQIFHSYASSSGDFRGGVLVERSKLSCCHLSQRQCDAFVAEIPGEVGRRH